jgi:hypothetical protein
VDPPPPSGGLDRSLSIIGNSATYGEPKAHCMIVGSRLFRSYLECPTKCWLRSRSEPPAANHYAEWISVRNETYFQGGLNRLLATFPQSDRAIAPPIPKNPNDVTWRVAFDMTWKAKGLESCLQAVVRVPANGRGRHDLFIPYRFEFLNKITKEHKLLLAFDALLLSESIGHEVNLAGYGKTQRFGGIE